MNRRAGVHVPSTRFMLLLLFIAGGIIVLGYRRISAPPTPLAFTFTTGGPVSSYGTVEIRSDGTERMVTAAPCLNLANPQSRVSPAELVRLSRLVHTVRFAALPPLIRSDQPNIDMSGHTISVYTPSRTITVVEAPYATNPRFDRLYTGLSDAAPFTSDACPTPTS